MISKKPRHIISSSDRKPCPVCGKASYSLGGVHPQCAVVQSDVVVRARKRRALRK
jgi:hypothetical protein